MSRVTELENEIKGLENKRTELIKELEVERQKKEIDYLFNYTEKCYLLTSNGDIAEDWWSSSGNDQKLYRQGNFLRLKKKRKENEINVSYLHDSDNLEISAIGIGNQIGTIFTKEDTIFIYIQQKVNVA